ncbi:MAG: dimethylarginine dimethylaminohydrolase family protein [Pseudobdellovibrionaceae bacterium]
MNTPISFPLYCKRVLMVSPEYFDIEYAINPFMLDKEGNLNKVDRPLADWQWNNLKKTFETLGLTVEVLTGIKGFPDMVFCANQCFPFLHPKTKNPTAVISHMRSSFRQGEVIYFENWLKENGYDVLRLEDKDLHFESNGDLVPHPGTNLFWGGYGQRTEKGVYEELHQRFGLEIATLELVHPQFYHLDTCFASLSQETVALVKESLSTESLRKIESLVRNVIFIPIEEASRTFAGNAFCPDSKNIVVEKGAADFTKQAEILGFKVHEVETSEFRKSGGSVFCLKLALPN